MHIVFFKTSTSTVFFNSLSRGKHCSRTDSLRENFKHLFFNCLLAISIGTQNNITQTLQHRIFFLQITPIIKPKENTRTKKYVLTM